MKNTIKCYRCGTEYPAPDKEYQEVRCPHCQGKMQLDKKTKRLITVIRIAFYVIVCLLVIALQFLIPYDLVASNRIVFMLAACIAFFCAFYFSEGIAAKIVASTSGLHYIHEYDKSDEKKEKKKR